MAKTQTNPELPKSYKYKELITEEELKEKELPANIQAKIKGLNMAIGRFKAKPTEDNLASINKIDLEICDLIQNHMEEELPSEEEVAAQEEEARKQKEKEEQDEADRVTAENKKKEENEAAEADRLAKEKAEQEAKDPQGAPKKAVKIESELKNLFESGQKTLTLEEIKKGAPVSYKDIFESYKEGEENGVETSRYSLLEKKDEKQTFELTQK